VTAAKRAKSSSSKTSSRKTTSRPRRAKKSPTAAALLKPTECLPYLINVITNYVNETMREDLRRVGMTVPRWTVLTALREDDGLAIGHLASRCMIRQSSLTRVVDQLERDGHVRRRAARGDQRVVQVFITRVGNALYESVVPGAIERASNEVRDLVSNEIDALSEVLERAASALKGKAPERPATQSKPRKANANRRKKSSSTSKASKPSTAVNRPMA
jgi:DNA-binding MarR family transcriptional regulator